MNHKHTWKKSPRKHGRPPRFFVVCGECGETRQAVIREGYLHVFTTNKPSGRMENYSIRLPRKPTKEEVKFFQEYIRKKM